VEMGGTMCDVACVCSPCLLLLLLLYPCEVVVVRMCVGRLGVCVVIFQEMLL